MKKREFTIWFSGVMILLIVLITAIKLYEPEEKGITRAVAYKALALSMASKEDCAELSASLDRHFLTDSEKDAWYGKYVDYLYENGIVTLAENDESFDANGFITYGELYEIALKRSEKAADGIKKKNKKNNAAVPENIWWNFYDTWLDYGEYRPEENEITIYAISRFTLYTDNGEFSCEGLSADPYIDNKISVISRSGEIIRIKNIISDSVIYNNVWVSENNDGTFTAYLGNTTRVLELGNSLGKSSDFTNQIVDIYISRGKLSKVLIKKDRIYGKVLSVKDDSIEIEGYGDIPTDEFFKVFKTYGNFEVKKRNNIVVGYDIHEFVVSNGKLCAALITREVNAKIIRVLIMDSGFKSLYHDSVTLVCDSDIMMTGKKVSRTIKAGEEYTIKKDDVLLDDGRIVLEAADKNNEIRLLSIERNQNSPSYGGKLEISSDDKGLTIVNELYMEDYLKKVVPSEMPASYGKEALKVQAVCARTYAYMQIISNGRRNLGAHVDDSTNYQVYNNIATSDSTDSAVMETYGQLIMYEGKPINAYYYSTSCGTSTDGSVWGGAAEAFPYLESRSINKNHDMLSLTTNDAFIKFIKDKNYDSYDSGYPFFRWETSITNKQLNDQISGVGNILSLRITERGAGGIAKKLQIDGSDGTRTISGQDSIRAAIGNPSLVIKKNDDSTVTGWKSLPSSYIAIEAGEPDENNIITFYIYGGGYGHGAGMSQNAAQAMSKQGIGYEEIIKFFYSGVEIDSLDSN